MVGELIARFARGGGDLLHKKDPIHEHLEQVPAVMFLWILQLSIKLTCTNSQKQTHERMIMQIPSYPH